MGSKGSKICGAQFPHKRIHQITHNSEREIVRTYAECKKFKIIKCFNRFGSLPKRKISWNALRTTKSKICWNKKVWLTQTQYRISIINLWYLTYITMSKKTGTTSKCYRWIRKFSVKNQKQKNNLIRSRMKTRKEVNNKGLDHKWTA